MAAGKAKAIRTRRAFSAEYKLEAVQRAEERRAAGVPLTQIARELGITPNLLRTWKRQAGGRATTVPMHGGRDISPILLRQIRRDIGVPVEDFLAA